MRRLRREATLDPLTGLHNRHHLESVLTQERAVRDAAFSTMAAERYPWHVRLETIEISIALRSSAALTGFLR
jgi:hypothetical protein